MALSFINESRSQLAKEKELIDQIEEQNNTLDSHLIKIMKIVDNIENKDVSTIVKEFEEESEPAKEIIDKIED